MNKRTCVGSGTLWSLQCMSGCIKIHNTKAVLTLIFWLHLKQACARKNGKVTFSSASVSFFLAFFLRFFGSGTWQRCGCTARPFWRCSRGAGCVITRTNRGPYVCHSLFITCQHLPKTFTVFYSTFGNGTLQRCEWRPNRGAGCGIGTRICGPHVGILVFKCHCSKSKHHIVQVDEVRRVHDVQLLFRNECATRSAMKYFATFFCLVCPSCGHPTFRTDKLIRVHVWFVSDGAADLHEYHTNKRFCAEMSYTSTKNHVHVSLHWIATMNERVVKVHTQWNSEINR